jgi:2'-hydroxyisoflavone reductase
MTSSTPSSRRAFLQASLATGAMLAGAASPLGLARLASARQEKPAKSLKILILGGSAFIGPALIEIARNRGHSVTIFNRGITEKRKGYLGDDVERLVGDRDPDKGEGIKALAGKKWDVCMDDSGFYPRHVKASAELLAPSVGQYIFVSSISAYADNSKPHQDESAALATLSDPNVETMGEEFQNYGGLKVLCEQAAEKALPGRTTIVRPGFIVGPGDGSDRFTYWPWRVQHSGALGYGMEMLAPGTPNDPIQVIDVRDLAAFMIHIAENNTIGVFNACGPTPSDAGESSRLTMGKLLDESKQVCARVRSGDGGLGEQTRLTWVSAAFLRQWAQDHPAPSEQVNTTIWIPPEDESAGFHLWSNAAAVRAGMKFRPIADTIRDTLEWFPRELERRVRVSAELVEQAKAKGEPVPNVGEPSKIRGGIPPELEKQVLEAWHKHEKEQVQTPTAR